MVALCQSQKGLRALEMNATVQPEVNKASTVELIKAALTR